MGSKLAIHSPFGPFWTFVFGLFALRTAALEPLDQISPGKSSSRARAREYYLPLLNYPIVPKKKKRKKKKKLICWTFLDL